MKTMSTAVKTRSDTKRSGEMRFERVDVKLDYEDLECDTGASGRTYVTPSGKKYPSITTVLSIRSKGFIQEWRARVGEEEANRIARHACTRGTALHNLAEQYIDGAEVDESVLMPHVKFGFNVLKPVLDQSLGRIYLQEKPLYSDHLGVAGRVDLVAEFDGKLSIVDFKTSKRRKDRDDIQSYFAQECAYSIMYEERTGIPITQLVTIMIVDNDPVPLVFKEHRDTWAKELITIIGEYNTAKMFGHIK